MTRLGVMWLAVVLSGAECCLAADWFVRPRGGGDYGSRDGRNFATAWDGLAAIDWPNIKPGDNVYVCDTHVGPGLTVRASGTDGSRIGSRGDWPGHPGATLGASAVFTAGWELHDDAQNVSKRAFEPPADYTDWHAFARPKTGDPIAALVRLHNVGQP